MLTNKLDEFQAEYDLLKVTYPSYLHHQEAGSFNIIDIKKTYKLLFVCNHTSFDIKIISNPSRTKSNKFKYIDRTECFWEFEKALDWVLEFYKLQNIPTKLENSVRFICDL